MLALLVAAWTLCASSPARSHQGTTTTSAVDCFGTRQLYPSQTNGETWCLAADPTTDARNRPAAFTANGDGSFKVRATQVRWDVYTTAGFHNEQVETDQKILLQRKYMQSPRDWKNVEITLYVRVNSFTSSTVNGAAHLELQARSGRHSNIPCQGTSYHSNTYVTGRAKFEKELEHTAGYTRNDLQKQDATTPLLGRWIGLKGVFQDQADGSVRLEQWLDDGGGQWRKVLEFVDAGTWGGGRPNCGGTPETIITWGGPMVILRWDNIDDLDVRAASVREIQGIRRM